MLLFSNNKSTPFVLEGGIGAGERRRCIEAIDKHLTVKGLEGGAKYCARVEVDAGLRGPQAEDEFIFKFLLAGPEAV